MSQANNAAIIGAMGVDFLLVVTWWATLFVVGAAAFPLTKVLFKSWYDGGYFFSKAVGLAVVSWLVYALGTIKVAPFSLASIIASLGLLFILGLVSNFQFLISNFQSIFKFIKNFKFQIKNSGKNIIGRVPLFLVEELFFLLALLFWSWIKGHEPSIRGLEKFMDYGFMQSILNSSYFPPPDMWYAGSSINYYYFGHLATAVLTKFSGLDLAYTFNLMLATLFAMTLTMSFSIGFQIGRIGRIGRIVSGALTAFLVTLAGNLQTLYAFTRGYTGEDPPPFWQLFWRLGEFWQGLPEGLNRYWYANATRFIPFTIHEFPSYSFVVSDVHGHVLSIPFTLLAIALLIVLFGYLREPGKYQVLSIKYQGIIQVGFLGFLVGILLMTNALDGPIYLGLFLILSLILNTNPQIPGKERRRQISLKALVVVAVAVLVSLPFLFHFKSFVSGIAVNCPPWFFANTKIGPLIFESVDKCQHSPLWMWLVLWGFFLYCGGWLFFHKKWQIERSDNPINGVLKVFFWFSLALIIFPEFFYFKDIYPAHFRSNTMFKLGYQAFILFSIISAYAIVQAASSKRQAISKKIFFFFLLPQLFLVSIYPIFSVRSYFGGLRNYEGLYGLNWLEREYPGDWAAVRWLNLQLTTNNLQPQHFALVEAEGDSYTDYARFSAFSGISTIVGWPVHEWLWRGTYDVVAPRREEVRLVYESEDLAETRELLERYGVRYVVVGTLERQKYPQLAEGKFSEVGKEVFRAGETVIYQVE